jgi:hypothetical protein
VESKVRKAVVRSQEPWEKNRVLIYVKRRVKWREVGAKGGEGSVRLGAKEGSNWVMLVGRPRLVSFGGELGPSKQSLTSV